MEMIKNKPTLIITRDVKKRTVASWAYALLPCGSKLKKSKKISPGVTNSRTHGLYQAHTRKVCV